MQLVAGDFFAEPLPDADAYVLMEVLHDWGDTGLLATTGFRLERVVPTNSPFSVVEAITT